MPATQPLAPPSYGESCAVLTTDSAERLQRKIAILLGGGSKCATVTPSDSTDLPAIGRIYCGTVTAGQTVKIDCALTGNTVVFTNPPQGGLIPGVIARRVYATGTTATNLLVLS